MKLLILSLGILTTAQITASAEMLTKAGLLAEAEELVINTAVPKLISLLNVEKSLQPIVIEAISAAPANLTAAQLEQLSSELNAYFKSAAFTNLFKQVYQQYLTPSDLLKLIEQCESNASETQNNNLTQVAEQALTELKAEVTAALNQVATEIIANMQRIAQSTTSSTGASTTY